MKIMIWSKTMEMLAIWAYYIVIHFICHNNFVNTHKVLLYNVFKIINGNKTSTNNLFCFTSCERMLRVELLSWYTSPVLGPVILHRSIILGIPPDRNMDGPLGIRTDRNMEDHWGYHLIKTWRTTAHFENLAHWE